MTSSLLNLLLLIVIAGVIMWLINAYVPMPGAIKSLLNILVLVILVIYVLEFFEVIGPILPIPTIAGGGLGAKKL